MANQIFNDLVNYEMVLHGLARGISVATTIKEKKLETTEVQELEMIKAQNAGLSKPLELPQAPVSASLLSTHGLFAKDKTETPESIAPAAGKQVEASSKDKPRDSNTAPKGPPR